ncbi:MULTISPECIES: DegT/DnrJ/EryC1/StrS family aminotransferase [unclassified Halorhabdus]|uniref:DegT/DnrJ/EryC1/StrS family aminotransferase n=1 Tax=unclassified Halorhabdus TaxID=2621901 RepID=UPI0023DB6090|nr:MULTISPECIES: DegT/DnrJ/EryC1/StrS family aminotransferase [unclassified Halorhabdus]WEL21121.1 DegT/DnrJ/EryC1/StrS aminotransferase [Halorhabdus sp. BNX81]
MDRQVSVAEPVLGEVERENVSEVLDSGRFVQGPFVEEFEEKWAEYTGVDHAVAVANGTVAIQVSLNALGLEPGDEVIVPSLTFGSTATAVVHQGGIPVFADIDRELYTLDYRDLERCVSDRTVAIMPVHLYGQPAAMDEIQSFAERHDIAVVEDAAQAHGASYKGDRVGSLGDVGCFSFYATKNITSGEGGIITTDDDELAEKLRRLRNHGLVDRDTHVDLGYNYRMSELHAAIGAKQVERLAEFNAKRRRISERLADELGDLEWLEPATVPDHVEHAYFWAPFEVKEDVIGLSGKEVWDRLGDMGVETRHRYNRPLYEQPVFRNHKGFNGEFPWSENENDHDYESLTLPNVEDVVGKMIGLPNHPNLTDDEIEYVVETVSEFRNTVADHSA